jgi:hypothetical protein
MDRFKHITQFVKRRNRSGKMYRKHMCYSCWSKKCLERYYRNREIILARMKQRYKENPLSKNEQKLRKFEKILGYR